MFITEAQAKYIKTLYRQVDLPINEDIENNLDSMTKAEASNLINELKEMLAEIDK